MIEFETIENYYPVSQETRPLLLVGMASKAHCCAVFDALEAHFEHRAPLALNRFASSGRETLAPTEAFPLFVTYNTLIDNDESELRGCIGTFASAPLESTLQHYALVAALEDTRFSPITKTDLSSLEAAVSILTDFEEIEDPYDWTIGKHGLRVHFNYRGRGRSATFLPDVAKEQGWTQDDTLVHLLRKGGWDGRGDWKAIALDLERYQSSIARITYAEYSHIRDALKQ